MRADRFPISLQVRGRHGSAREARSPERGVLLRPEDQVPGRAQDRERQDRVAQGEIPGRADRIHRKRRGVSHRRDRSQGAHPARVHGSDRIGHRSGPGGCRRGAGPAHRTQGESSCVQLAGHVAAHRADPRACREQQRPCRAGRRDDPADLQDLPGLAAGAARRSGESSGEIASLSTTMRDRPAVRFERVTLSYGARAVWSDLSLDIAPGTFVAILGPNGSGKTSLLRAILGLVTPSAGRIEVLDRAPRRGDPGIGYVPQQSSFDAELPFRGRVLVRLGIDGHRWGIASPDRTANASVARALAEVEAQDYADAPIGRLSGGEQQRLRIAQALVGNPRILLCDELLANLYLRYQHTITDLIAGWRDRSGGTVLFVTHDVNPVLRVVDQVLFVVNGRWAAGTPDEVLRSEKMSELYGSHVDVVRVHGRILVVGESTESGFNIEEPHHPPAAVVDHGDAH